MRILISFILCFFFGGLFDAIAQNSTIKFEHYTVNEGLSQSNVKCIQQDDLGFIWFGTINGLNRFDGLNFVPYHAIPGDSSSLTSSHITTLFQDRNGNFWVGTHNGLNLYQRETNNFKRFIHLKNNLNSLPHNYIQDIIEDHEGYLWIATKGGLCKYDVKTNRFETFQQDEYESNGLISNNIRCLYQDIEQNIWVGFFALDGLQKYDPNTNSFVSVLMDKESLETPTPLNVTVWDIFEDSKGNFWLGTNEYGLILFDRTSQEYTIYKENNDSPDAINFSTISDIEEDEAGNLLLATEGGGLNILNLSSFDKDNPAFVAYQEDRLNPFSINNNILFSIFKDKTGLIWIGTKNGINKIDKGIQKFTHFQSNQGGSKSLTNNDVWSIMQDHVGNIWVGTADGLNRISPERTNIDYYFHTPNQKTTISGNHILSIYQDKEFDIWIGTDHGLNKLPYGEILEPQFSQFQHNTEQTNTISNDLVHCILEDNIGNLWVGTQNGLNLMDRSSGTFTHFYNQKSKDSNIIHCLLSDKQGRLWMGTEQGLVEFNLQSNKFFNHMSEDGNPNSLNSNFVQCIFEDVNGTLWLGTSRGLNKMIEKNGSFTFESYSGKNGLPYNNIYAIKGDRKGNLWISTNKGLSQFNPRKTTSKKFTNKDGLQEGKFNPNACYKNWQGELFFGGTDGMNVFDPEKLPLNTMPPEVVLTDFMVNYEPVVVRKGGQLEKHISIADQITLYSNDSRDFSFEFVALNYTLSEKNAYRFKLENYDETWRYPNNQNIASYNNMDPGNYVFNVQAANNDEVWNIVGASVKLTIEPTFTETWYFKATLLLSIAGIGYLIYLNRTRSLHQRSIILEKMVKERTEQLEKKNTELATTVKTLEDTQQQLVVSEKMASLGQLTAGIAHEINNPINFISSNVQALKMDFQDMQNVLKKVKELEKSRDLSKLTQELILLGKQLDFELMEEEIGELLAGIERGTERTVNIVSSLRTFSRNSTDNFSKADIHEGIDSTITILNSQLNGHITIVKNYGELPLIKCQISRLNQVFLNIINNSIQAINAKSNGVLYSGIIKITTKKIGDKIRISIKDNGSGMDETTRKRVFEPFYTTKDVGDGTGLGLSISYGIIEQHNGKIEVFSAPDEGTEFLIYLPLEGENK